LKAENMVSCCGRLKRDAKEMVGEEGEWLRIVVWWGGRFNCNCVCSRNVSESEGGGYLTLWERKMW